MRVDFRDVFAATANAYMLLDPQLRYVYANAAYLELTGARLDAIVGRRIFDLFPNDPTDPDDASRRLLQESLERALRTKQRDHLAIIPYRVARTPGGAPEPRLWSATHTPILDANGEVALILQHTQDVTEIQVCDAGADVLSRAQQVQRANSLLDAQVASLRAMFDQAPGFIAFLRGKHHVFELTNAAYDALVGRSVVGMPIREALPDLGGQGYFELLDQVYASGEAYVGRGMPAQISRGNGPETRYVDFLYQPIRKPDGAVLGILVQGHDVTEQKRAELRQLFLTRASERLATTADDVDEALRDLAEAAVATFADWAIVDLFEAGTSRRVACAHASPDDAALADALRAWPIPAAVPSSHALAGGIGQRPRVITEVTPEAIASFIRGPDHAPLVEAVGMRSLLALPLVHRGQPLGMVMLLTTTRSQRRYDDKDLAAMEELGHVVAGALDNAHLLREREELIAREQAANRAKDDFLAMLGHELRNPLAPILTAVQLMRLRGDDGARREIAVIERQAQHLVRLVDDLLDVTRIARGKIDLRTAPLDISAVVVKAVEIVAPQFEQKGHQLTVDVPRGLRVFGDETRLSQVVSNLLTNAARYTEPGGHVALAVRRVGDAIEIAVTDDGIGITAEMLPQIFDLFVQAPQAQSRPKGGLGLGLSLVRRLVELHDGTVTASSAGPGAGSTFVVRLPALGEERPQVPDGARALASVRRVLLVDDDPDASELLADLLRRRGHMVVIAHDADAALAEVASAPPDVAVLDIGLPGRDGYELATAMRGALAGRGLHLIALTGYDRERDRARSTAAGFDAHLAKPVDTATLLRMIESTRLAG